MTNLVQRKRYRGKPDSVGYRNNANTLTSDGADPEALERLFSEVERLAAPAIAQVHESQAPPAGDDLLSISLLMATQVVRDLRHRESIMRFMSDVSETMLRMVTSTPDTFAAYSKRMRKEGIDLGEYEEMRDFIDGSKVVVKDNDWVKAMTVEGLETVAATMASRSWNLLVIPDDVTCSFITSDRPVKLRWTSPELTRGPYPPGFALDNTRVTFPLGQRLMLFGEFSVPSGLSLPVDERLAAMMNSNTAYGSGELYSSSEHFLWADESGVKRGADALLQSMPDAKAQG